MLKDFNPSLPLFIMFAMDYFFEDVDNRDPNVLNKLYVQKRWWKLANRAQRVGRYMADRRDAGSIPANVCFQKNIRTYIRGN